MTQTGTGLETHPEQQEAAKITGGGECGAAHPGQQETKPK